MELGEGLMIQNAMDRVPFNRPLNIVVLLGGWSSEREVSLSSGRAVIDALRARRHDVRELDPAFIDILTYPWVGIDAAFIALHGAFGEDGTVQSLLDELKVPYTGSDPASCRIAMDKAASKQRFIADGLPTPKYQLARSNESFASVAEKANAIGYPLVIKPNAQGSSIGVTIVTEPDGLKDAVLGAFRYDPLILIEAFIPGRELTVAVLERRPLPAIEVRPARAFYDYAAKYNDDNTGYVFDTDLAPAVIRHAESVAVSAVQSLGCSGVTRVDLRVDSCDQPWLLEVNAIPGLTDHSLVPKAAARAGISFVDLCEQLVTSKLNVTPRPIGSRAA